MIEEKLELVLQHILLDTVLFHSFMVIDWLLCTIGEQFIMQTQMFLTSSKEILEAYSSSSSAGGSAFQSLSDIW